MMFCVFGLMVTLVESNTRTRCAPRINGVPFILAGSRCRVLDSAMSEYQLRQVGNRRVFKVLSVAERGGRVHLRVQGTGWQAGKKDVKVCAPRQLYECLMRLRPWPVGLELAF